MDVICILGVIIGITLVTTLGTAVDGIVQFINQAEATTKLIDTSTGEVRAGTVGETSKSASCNHR